MAVITFRGTEMEMEMEMEPLEVESMRLEEMTIGILDVGDGCNTFGLKREERNYMLEEIMIYEISLAGERE